MNNARTLLALFALAAPVSGQTLYLLHPAEGSRLSLAVEKTGLLRGKQHLFLFSRFDGTVTWDSAQPERSRVSLSIDAASITCQDTWVSAKDLRKIQDYAYNDMLAATRFPRIQFVSMGARSVSPNTFTVSGNLTIRNVTKPAEVTVTVDARETTHPVYTGTAVIRLTDFGLKPPSAALGTIGTKNEMTLEFHLLAAQAE